MKTGLETPLERLVFHDGQILASLDFREEGDKETTLWALHNRYVHDTWGVVAELEVDVTPDNHVVRLHAGYAIDAFGRSIIIRGANEFPVPSTASPTYLLLVISWCGPNGWRPAQGWNKSDGVPVALVRVTGGMAISIDTSIRPLARPLKRPRVGSGITLPGGTGWVAYAAWIEAVVDTSESGFVAAPQYFIQVSGVPAFVAASDSVSLTVRILSKEAPFGISLTAAQAEASGLTIFWIGIEMGGAA